MRFDLGLAPMMGPDGAIHPGTGPGTRAAADQARGFTHTVI
jgi:hypothetical protein